MSINYQEFLDYLDERLESALSYLDMLGPNKNNTFLTSYLFGTYAGAIDAELMIKKELIRNHEEWKKQNDHTS